jgi:hypothetical protein
MVKIEQKIKLDQQNLFIKQECVEHQFAKK